MESNEKNGNVGIERHNPKNVVPLTKDDVQAILFTMPQGLDADDWIVRVCNEAVHYARMIGKA